MAYFNNNQLYNLLLHNKIDPNEGLVIKIKEIILEIVKLYFNRKRIAESCMGYYIEDMKHVAMVMCIKHYDYFDPLKSNNPFAYFTQIIYASICNFIAKENKHRQTIADLQNAVSP